MWNFLSNGIDRKSTYTFLRYALRRNLVARVENVSVGGVCDYLNKAVRKVLCEEVILKQGVKK